MSGRLLCKDCWIAHEPKSILARCKRCEANTQIERLDPLNAKAASVSANPIVCRLHGNEPLDVFCGNCRRPLSPRTRLAEGGVLAILGDTEAGKTSLLWILSERLRQPNDTGITIRTPLGDSEEQMMRTVRDIFDYGRLSATPATDADVRNYAWEVSNAEGETTVMAIHDAAGEIWLRAPELSQSAYQRFYDYLDLVGSVVFAIDGARVAEGLETFARGGVAAPRLRAAQTHELQIIDAVSARLRARGHRIPGAVVITKADTLWHREDCAMLRPESGASADVIDAAVRDLLLRSGRRLLVQTLDEVFDPVRYFAVSAFGRAPQQPLRVEDLAPARVEEPFVALLGMVGLRA